MPFAKFKQSLPWALYNFASTVYAINIISLYFALWITVDMKGADIYYSLAFSISVLIAALAAPLVGYFADRVGRRMPFLIVFAICCILGTASLGLIHQLLAALIIFTITNCCYQSGEIVHSMLIPQVSGGSDVGKVAGYGTGLGYFGTIAGVLLVSPFVLHFGRQAAFIPTAILYGLFALPSFFLIRDPKQTNNCAASLKISDVLLQPILTLWRIRRYPDFATSLLAIFMAFNTIDTVFIFMSVYLKKVVGFADSEFTIYYIACSSFAILSGIVSGFVVDRFGAKKVLIASLYLWCFALLLAIIDTHKFIFWFVGPIVGTSLGATWTSSRTLIVDLAPPERASEFIGFYGMAIKLAAIIGPLLWGISVGIFSFLGVAKYRITLLILLSIIVIGLLSLRHVSLRNSKESSFRELTRKG